MAKKAPKKTKASVSKRPNIFLRFLKYILYLFVASLLYLVVCKWIFPPITITQIGALFSGYDFKRDYVSWNEIAPDVKLAAIASEDQLFPVHGGFDWKAIEKSMNGTQQSKKRKKKREKGAAASTITQQTAKNVFLWQGSGITRYIRKPFEAVYTKTIELVWGKQRILEVYLNVAEMGPGIFGIEAASRNYFNKPASKLSTQEAAMIIASLPNPKRFTVKPVSRRVKWRAPGIVRQMGHLRSDPNVSKLVFSR
ncbi:MAG: monofunctional biosynthetic peptidoglycan transglycosylase [Sphingobacteriales bacterium]|nr:MAG: monofunctional biosynthetic peptidoglycan transglycosylase [Sphingobacteriales bacterium]